MKKLLFCAVVLTLMVSACKKKISDPSIVVTVSFPTINFNDSGNFVIPLGGALPTPSQVGSAYDSFYKVPCTLVLIDSTVNASVAGNYYALATAQNKYGFISYSYYYVTVQ